MKKILLLALLFGMSLCATSCYKDYLNDYESPTMGFAHTGQIRTLVSGNNTSYVGVSIGGKRELDLSEWACFAVDESILAGTPYKLLPGEYYSFADDNMMRARRKTVFTADVAVIFKDRFFEDPMTLKNTYALPLRIVATSFDEDGGMGSSILNGGETAIIVFKYISEYSGTYYRVGYETEVDASGNEVGKTVYYNDKDLIKNPTVTLATLARNGVSRPGLGNGTKGGLNLFVTPVEGAKAYSVRPEVTKGAEIVDFSGRYVLDGDYTFYSGDEKAPQFELDYTYRLDDKYYRVSEKLVLRQRPEKDLRAETF